LLVLPIYSLLKHMFPHLAPFHRIDSCSSMDL
jgi:hypothetical protein